MKIEDLLGKISWTAGMVLVYKSAIKAMIEKDFTEQKAKIEKLKSEHEKLIQRKLNLQDSFLDGYIDSEDFKEMKKRVEEQIFKVEETINSYQSEMSPFKEYLNKTLSMIQKLPSFWRRKSDGKTKKKILGCIFRDKIENLDFKVATTPFTSEMSVLLGLERVLTGVKTKKRSSLTSFLKWLPLLGSNQGPHD